MVACFSAALARLDRIIANYRTPFEFSWPQISGLPIHLLKGNLDMFTALVVGALVTALMSMVLGGLLLSLLRPVTNSRTGSSRPASPSATIHEFPSHRLAPPPRARTQRLAA